MKYVYKIVAVLAALAVVVVAVFIPLVHIKLDSIVPSVLVTLGKIFDNDATNEILENNGGNLPSAIAEDIAVFDFFDPNSDSVAGILSGIDFSGSETESQAFESLISPVITMLIVFALLIICAIATVVIAIVSKNNRNVIYACVTGIGLSVMLSKSFSAVAAPFLNGDITLSSLTGSLWASLLGTVSEFELTSAFWMIPALFACIIVWTFLYNVTLPEEAKRERKLMLGESEE